MPRSTLSYAEAAIVATICFGFFIHGSVQAVLAGFPEARFSDSGTSWVIAIEVMLTALALLYLRSRHFDIVSLNPAPTLKGTLIGLALFIAAWLVATLAVSPFYSAEQPQMTEFSYSGSTMTGIVPFAMVNGTFEEVFLLGVLTRGLRGYGLSIAIGLPLLVRVLYHLYQGPLGTIWVLAFGLTFAFAYVRHQKLWPPVLAHILWDIVPVALAAG